MFDWLLTRKLNHLGAHANPEPEFVRGLEQKLNQQIAKPSRFFTLSKTLVASGTSLIMLLAGTSVYAYSSDSVLPDHPLYPLRQTIEKTEEAIATTPEKKAAVQLKLVERRVHERQLLDEKKKPITDEQVQQFVTSAESAIDATENLAPKQREAFARATEKLEVEYTASLAKTRDNAKDEKEKNKIDQLIKKQADAISKRVEKAQNKRAHFRPAAQNQEQRKEVRDEKKATTTKP